MDLFKSAVILLCFAFLRISVYAQAGDSIDFNDYIPEECSYEPLFNIGLIADPQYCDCEPAGTRYYRETMWKLPQAIDTMNKYQVDFVMNLGDMIDRYYESYDSVSKHYEKLNMPYYNLLGNHEFEEVPDELKSTIVSRYGMPGYYYAFNMKDWRFLVLDGTELATYSRYIHPELAEEGDSVWNSVQGMINEASWNGGISKVQQDWMRSEIEGAVDSGLNVMVFSHFPVYPDSGENNLWNDHEIVALLEQYPNVVAYVNGHLHLDNYGYRNNIHYYTQNAMLDTPDSTAFSIMSIYPKEIVIQGFGRIPDRILPYDNFKTKMVQIYLSDTILYYSHLKNDLTGKLSHTSSDTSMPVNFFIDTARYHNRYFSISSDSLMLNTDEDLSLLPDLKVNVIAVDCDADTFSQTFHIRFDTTVMSFRYPLSDTVISVYEDYNILADSLMEDHSRAGMDISLFAPAPGMVIFKDTLDTIKIIPQKVGGTEIYLNAYDPFTGRNYQQAFYLEIYDPLNHAPYHEDSMVTEYIVLLSDTLKIPLNGIFSDPDGDMPDYFYAIHDTSLATGRLSGDQLIISGLQRGTTDISITADDNRGGVDSVTLSLCINSSPVRVKQYTAFIYTITPECTYIYLDTIFADPDGDVIQYQIIPTMDSITIDSSNQLKICPGNEGVYKIHLSLSDNKGGLSEDSIEVRFNTPTALEIFSASRLTEDLKIFPNPSSGIVHIQFISAADFSFGICFVDPAGRIIHQSGGYRSRTGTNQFDITIESILVRGPSVLILFTEDKILATVSLLIK